MVKQKYQAYMAATHTVAKTKQIVMLYDGMIRWMRQAKEAIVEKRIEDRYHLLIKVSTILNGLQGALDFEEGGSIARVLYNYYASIDGRVFAIHRSNNIEACDDIIADLKQMRDVWQEIDSGQSETSSAAQTATTTTAAKSEAPKAPPSGVTLSA